MRVYETHELVEPAMLDQKELAALLGLLSDDTRAIEAVGALFQRTFAKPDHFRVATALWCVFPVGCAAASSGRAGGGAGQTRGRGGHGLRGRGGRGRGNSRSDVVGL